MENVEAMLLLPERWLDVVQHASGEKVSPLQSRDAAMAQLFSVHHYLSKLQAHEEGVGKCEQCGVYVCASVPSLAVVHGVQGCVKTDACLLLVHCMRVVYHLQGLVAVEPRDKYAYDQLREWVLWRLYEVACVVEMDLRLNRSMGLDLGVCHGPASAVWARTMQVAPEGGEWHGLVHPSAKGWHRCGVPTTKAHYGAPS